MAKPQDLKDLLTCEVQLLHSAENQLLKSIPQMIEEAYNEELKALLDMHWKETGMQVKRLEKVADYLQAKADATTNACVKALLSENEALLQRDTAEPLVDITLIVRIQKIEHYEIAAYSQAATMAQELGLLEVTDLLRETLLEERNTSALLSRLAQNNIVKYAARL